jgi:outer membrane protein assembly factor BamE (lipoprotein component of BamABCDE complex)
MRRSTTSWAVGMVLAGWMAIAGVRSAAGQDIGFNKITQVQPGMTMLQVLQTLGPPSDIRGHTFIYSMTTSNTQIAGKVVFASKGSPLDQTKVVKVEPNPVQERFK